MSSLVTIVDTICSSEWVTLDAWDSSDYKYDTEYHCDSKRDALSEELQSPPFKKTRMQDSMADSSFYDYSLSSQGKKNSKVSSTAVLSDPPTSSHKDVDSISTTGNTYRDAPAEKQQSSPFNKTRMQDSMADSRLNDFSLSSQGKNNSKIASTAILSDPPNGSHKDVDSISSTEKTFDWQEMQQDPQAIKPIISSRSVNTVASIVAPIQRRVRYAKNKLNSTCHICKVTFRTSYKLKIHMSSHTGGKGDICNISGKGFTRGPDFNQPRHVHPSHTGGKGDTCNISGKGFTRGPDFNKPRHVHPSGRFPCPICDKFFLSATDRLIHVLTQGCTSGHRHLRLNGKVWHCITCNDKEFVKKEEAERHAREHELGKDLHCLICNYDFKGKKANDLEAYNNLLVPHVKKMHHENLLILTTMYK